MKQISQSLANQIVDFQGIPLELEKLCAGGILITGTTGCGKTTTILNPMLGTLLAHNKTQRQKKAAAIYFASKGVGGEDFVKQIPKSRRKDIVRIGGKSQRKLVLLEPKNYKNLDDLPKVVSSILLEAMRHIHRNKDTAGNHKIYWEGQTQRVLEQGTIFWIAAQNLRLSSAAPITSPCAILGTLQAVSVINEMINTIYRPKEKNKSNDNLVEMFVKQLSEISEAKSIFEIRRRVSELKAEAEKFIGCTEGYNPLKQLLYRLCCSLEYKNKELLTITNQNFSFWGGMDETTWRCIEGEVFSMIKLLSSPTAKQIFCESSNVRGSGLLVESQDELFETPPTPFSPSGDEVLPYITFAEVIHEGRILVIELDMAGSLGSATMPLALTQLALMDTILARPSLQCRSCAPTVSGSDRKKKKKIAKNDAKEMFVPVNAKRPIFIAIDECHTLLSSGRESGISRFLSQSREFGAIPILSTQNLRLIHNALNDPNDTEAFLALVNTRIFAANREDYTNSKASELCGSIRRERAISLGSLDSWDDPEIENYLVSSENISEPAASHERFFNLLPGQFFTLLANGSFYFSDWRHGKPIHTECLRTNWSNRASEFFPPC